MEKPAAAAAVVFNLAAFACSVASEFKKAKMNDMKLDGRLCSLPRTPAFGLGIAAITCLSIAQIAGISSNKCRTVAILSWVCFGLATILLGTGSGMNDRQRYGTGWTDGDCYVVRTGVYLGAAVLMVANLALSLGLRRMVRPWCCKGEDGRDHEVKQGEV